MLHAALIISLATAALPTGDSSLSPALTTVAVDSARREVVITMGPYDVKSSDPMMEHMHMGKRGEDHSRLFTWPFDAWLNQFRLTIEDASGHPLPRRLLHHYALVDFDRRELAYPIAQRLLGGGEESDDVSLPWTVALSLPAGHRLGFFFMWNNQTGRELDGVRLRLRLAWIPRNLQPAPLLVFPFWVDVAYDVEGDNVFDDPPGGCTRVYEFTLPISGHLLAAGGHLHAYGASIRLEDAETGRLVTRVVAH